MNPDSPPDRPRPLHVLHAGDGDITDRPAITPPADVADRLNQLFLFNTKTEQFATMIFGVVDAKTGELRYVSAGHAGPVYLPTGQRPVLFNAMAP